MATTRRRPHPVTVLREGVGVAVTELYRVLPEREQPQVERAVTLMLAASDGVSSPVLLTSVLVLAWRTLRATEAIQEEIQREHRRRRRAGRR